MHKNDLSATNTMQLKAELMPNPSEQMKGIPNHHGAGATPEGGSGRWARWQPYMPFGFVEKVSYV